MSPNTRSRYRGTMLGAAIGDALGAPVEFLKIDEIHEIYGEYGVEDLEPWGTNPAGYWTDDTQMTIATAEGLLRALQRARHRGAADTVSVVYRRYLEWLASLQKAGNWRGPGESCLSALASADMGMINAPINQSKGAGGLMRAAPAGLAGDFGQGPFFIGAECAAITHGHPTGYLAAAFLAQMVSVLVDGGSISDAVARAVGQLTEWEAHDETLRYVDKGTSLAEGDLPASEAIPSIGEGWVAEEALGIALFCATRYPEDYRAGVLAAVNHGGDSDTTGCVTGAILGAALGEKAIPERWADRVEGRDRLVKLSDDMHAAFREDAPLSEDDYPGF